MASGFVIIALFTAICLGLVLLRQLSSRLNDLRDRGLAPPATPDFLDNGDWVAGWFWLWSDAHHGLVDRRTTILVYAIRWCVPAWPLAIGLAGLLTASCRPATSAA